MKIPRRQFLCLTASAAALPVLSGVLSAQTYPTRPITMIVPGAGGGTQDFVARIVAEGMRRSLGQPVVVEYIGGADGSIGVGRLARAKPDGYTIDVASSSTHILPPAFLSVPYDILNDFEPISPLVLEKLALFAKKTLPAKDLNELIAWLKANPNKASAGSATSGQRLAYALFQKESGTHFTLVPYRGGAQTRQDLLAGHIDLLIAGLDLLPMVRAGSIKAYAVTGDARVALAPDIPTYAEMGLPAMSSPGWQGLFAPKGTPRHIIDRLNAAAVEALADPVARSRLADIGEEVFPREHQTVEALGALVKADTAKWWPIIRELGIRAE
jgi:tripartite-type tricarboxylate transporter receptor subunit TctC